VFAAVYALSLPIPYGGLVLCSGTNNQPVTFVETGLPTGTTWSVDVNGTTRSSAGTNITFSLASGPTFPFTVPGVIGYSPSPSGGSIGLSGVPATEDISFRPSPAATPTRDVSPASRGPVCSVCTYPAGTPVPGSNCYQTPKNMPGVVPPTLGVGPLHLGALPFGSLALQPESAYFYNTYTGLLRGADYSLFISFAAVAVAAVIGLVFGLAAGLLGRMVDRVVSTLADVFRSVPLFLFPVLIIPVVSILWPINVRPWYGIEYLVLAFVLPFWPSFALAVRRQVRAVKELHYVEYSRAVGATRGRIVVRHILPTCALPLAREAFSVVAFVPQFLAVYAFLGLTIWPTPYFPEWGTIAAFGISDFVNQFVSACEQGPCVLPWWLLLFPFATLALFTLGTLFIAEGLTRIPDA
jgi:ABC-type dipeptide/oligopeptide/nickel transport system permease subunit